MANCLPVNSNTRLVSMAETIAEVVRSSTATWVAVFHAWHAVAYVSDSLPVWHVYDSHGRIVVALAGIAACLLHMPQAGAVWLGAVVCDVVGYHELYRPPGHVPISALILILSVLHPYASLALAVVCAVWLGLVWQMRVRRRVYQHETTWKLVTIWTAIVVSGMVGVVGGVLHGSRWWSWATLTSVVLYTLLYTGRFLPSVIYGTADPVRHRSPTNGSWRQLDPAGAVQRLAASGSSDDRRAAQHDVQRLLDDCFDDSGHSIEEERASADTYQA